MWTKSRFISKAAKKDAADVNFGFFKKLFFYSTYDYDILSDLTIPTCMNTNNIKIKIEEQG